jgi:putative hydroxymethylpyrimidine transport system substrate-binding protein
MLDWTPNPDHVAVFVGERKGYFRREGLKLRVRAPADPTTPLKLLAAGRTDLAISYEPELFFAAQKRLPVVAVAALVPQPLDSLISLRPLPSLAGHSVGITGVPTDDAFLATILARSGVAAGDVKVVHVGYELVPALLSHRVDAILGAYRNVEGIQLRQRGLRPSIVPVDRAGVPHYDELVVAANRERLHRDDAYAAAVRSFVAALARGNRAALADPATALAAVEAETESPAAFLRASVPATTALLRGAPCLTASEWTAFGRWMAARKLVSRPVAAADVMTTEYLPDSCR